MIKFDVKLNNGIEAFGTTEKTITACEHVENVDAKFMAHHMHLHNALIPEDVATSVLNAFCAMVSARSYREGKSVEDALDELKNPARFDQSVVEQLAAVLETAEGLKAMKV